MAAMDGIRDIYDEDLTTSIVLVVKNDHVFTFTTELTISNTKNNSVKEFTVTDKGKKVKATGEVRKVDKGRWILLNADGVPIYTGQAKGKDKWQVFSGKSTDSKDLLYDIEKVNAEYHVFSKTKKDGRNYTVEGSYPTCTVSVDGSNKLAAEMQSPNQSEIVVTIYSGIDFALITLLFVILRYIYSHKKDETLELL